MSRSCQHPPVSFANDGASPGTRPGPGRRRGCDLVAVARRGSSAADRGDIGSRTISAPIGDRDSRMKRVTGTSRDDGPTPQQHDPLDAGWMVLGEAQRPDVTDRSTDDRDPLDAQPVEDLAEDVGDERPVRRSCAKSTGTAADPPRSRGTIARVPVLPTKRPPTSDAQAARTDRPGTNSRGSPDPMSWTREPARGDATSTNPLRRMEPVVRPHVAASVRRWRAAFDEPTDVAATIAWSVARSSSIRRSPRAHHRAQSLARLCLPGRVPRRRSTT